MAMDKQTEKDYLQTIEDLRDRLREKDEIIKKLRHIIKSGIMFGKDEIMLAYNWTEYILKKLIKRGLPCLIVDRLMYAHKDNITEYFKQTSRHSYSNAPESIIDDEEK